MNDQTDVVFDSGHGALIRLQHVGFQLQPCKEQLLAGSSAEACECLLLMQKRNKGITLKILGLHALNLCPKFAICQHCPWQSCTTAQIPPKKVRQVAALWQEDEKKESL